MLRAAPPGLLILAHGSRDPRSAVATRALTRAVAAARGGLPVRHAFLDLSAPRALDALSSLARAGSREAVVAPLLLTAAYHGRVDVPAVLAEAAEALPELSLRAAGVLGPDPRLLDGLTRRLGKSEFDAVVLAAAGSSDPAAVATVHGMAAALGERHGVAGRAAFASTAPGVGDVVGALRDAGAERVAVASYFLAPGLLYDRAAEAARRAGAVTVAEPLVAAPELVEVVLARYDAAAAAVGLAAVA
ncbi:MAG: cobalamin biosynthesis protein CbiX [Micromonosporaceae bacterium]|nr:cobalamin biosynthesis protein CbiX [Micromonosporaceae bacterium]